MADNSLPVNVGRLLDQHIYSVSQLETLLFLRKFQDRRWTAHEVANELHTNDTAALDMLVTLYNDGLIELYEGDGDGQFAYVPNGALEADVEALSRAYKETRLRVVDRIYQKPDRGSSLRSIADSFLFRGDD